MTRNINTSTPPSDIWLSHKFVGVFSYKYEYICSTTPAPPDNIQLMLLYVGLVKSSATTFKWGLLCVHVRSSKRGERLTWLVYRKRKAPEINVYKSMYITPGRIPSFCRGVKFLVIKLVSYIIRCYIDQPEVRCSRKPMSILQFFFEKWPESNIWYKK